MLNYIIKITKEKGKIPAENCWRLQAVTSSSVPDKVERIKDVDQSGDLA